MDLWFCGGEREREEEERWWINYGGGGWRGIDVAGVIRGWVWLDFCRFSASDNFCSRRLVHIWLEILDCWI
jgi:hypothetical protein